MRCEVEIRFPHGLRICVSLEVMADPKVYMQAASRFIGFTAIRFSVAYFQARSPLLVSPSYRLSQKRPSASHPSVRQLLLGAPSLRSTPLAGLSTRAAPIRGFGPPHDITNSRPLMLRFPKSQLCSVLRRSQPRDGFLRKLARRLISSRSRVQDPSCSGAYSLRTAVLSRR
jgi:hypothetical protein